MSNRVYLRIVRAIFLLGCGGAVSQLSCNPSVNEAIIDGLETTSLTFANTLITALFAGLGGNSTPATP